MNFSANYASFNELATRYDSQTTRFMAFAQRPDATEEQIARDRVQLNAARLSGYRADGGVTSKGLMLARELEQVLQEVVRVPRAPFTALDLFATDSSIREGAETVTIRRIEQTGSASYYDGAHSNIPGAGVFRDEESWKVLPIVSGYEITMFSEQSASFAGINLEQELRDSVVHSIHEFKNRKAWEGDTARRALGALNQPYVPRTNFGLTLGDAADGEALAQEFLRLSGLVPAITEGVFHPVRMIVSHRVKAYLMQRELGTYKEKTLYDRILERSAYLQSIDEAHELAGAGPNGEDVILFDAGKDMRRGFTHQDAKGITFLPVQQHGFKKSIPAYLLYGGVRCTQPLNQLVAYATLGTGVQGVY